MKKKGITEFGIGLVKRIKFNHDFGIWSGFQLSLDQEIRNPSLRLQQKLRRWERGGDPGRDPIFLFCRDE